MPENNNPSPPDTKKQHDKPYNPPPRRYFGQVTVTLNKELFTQIDDLAKKRHKGRSAIGQMLFNMGLAVYLDNEASGVTTSEKQQQSAALRRAQAEAEAARKSLRKQGDNKNVTAVTPVLFEVSPDPDE